MSFFVNNRVNNKINLLKKEHIKNTKKFGKKICLNIFFLLTFA